MTLGDRIELALNIVKGLGGQIDGKQWHDLLLHLSEAQAKLKNLPIHDVRSEDKCNEHQYHNVYFVDDDKEPFELDCIKCIKCGKEDTEI